jgi:hypothetical protein
MVPKSNKKNCFYLHCSDFKAKNGRNGPKKRKTCFINVSYSMASNCQKNQNRFTLMNKFAA